MNPSSTSSLTKTLVILLSIGCLGLVYLIVSGIHAAQTTGVLNITTPDKQATISVSRNDSQAEVIGIGRAHVRLTPGSYLVAASSDGKIVTTTVQINQTQTTAANLDPKNATFAPSVDNIAFQGENALLDNGMTTGQVKSLRQALFDFKPNVKTVYIETSSVEPGPRDPNRDTGFTLQFAVTLDSTTRYAATVSYSVGNAVHLTLTDPQTHTQAYSKTVDFTTNQ